MNIPATPLVRNAIRIARCSPDSLAAAATRTLPRTHRDMPVNPVSAENSAPTRKKALRPQRTLSPSAGSTSKIQGMMKAKTPSVLNCLLR